MAGPATPLSGVHDGVDTEVYLTQRGYNLGAVLSSRRVHVPDRTVRGVTQFNGINVPGQS